MKKILLFLVFAFAITEMQAQFVYKIKADSLLVTNDSCTAELNLENSTKNVKGFLYNKGNGRTEFRKIVKLNDTTFIMGGDTLVIGGSRGSINFGNSDLSFTGDRWHHANNHYVVFNDLQSWYMQTIPTFQGSVPNLYSFLDLEGSTVDLRTEDGIGRAWGLSANKFATTIYNDTWAKQTLIYLDTNSILFKTVNTYRMAINSNGQVGIGTTSPLDKFHVVGTARITDTLKLVNIASKSDTTNFKPMIADNSGNVFKMNSWPAAPLTLQQVTSYGNTTTNKIKPYPSALPVGGSTDSVVVWSATDSLLKKVAPVSTLTLQQVTTNGNTTTNKIKPYPAALPVGASTDSVVVWSATDSLLKKVAPTSALTLQQVTTNGNTTTNTIKPYPAALPVGSNTDSVVVWSSSDSLLKKVGAKQTFAQTSTATISASTVETSLTSSGSGSLTIPAAAWFAGKTYKIVLHGTYSTSSTNPTNLTLKIKLGATVIAQNVVFLGSAKSNIPFEIRAELTCRTTGSSGTVYTMGMINSGDDWLSQIDNGTSAATVNLSTSQTLNITATLNDNHTGNAVSAYMILLEALN